MDKDKAITLLRWRLRMSRQLRDKALARPLDDPQREPEIKLAERQEYSARLSLARQLSNYQTGVLKDMYEL